MSRFRVLAAVLLLSLPAAAQPLPEGGAPLPHRTPAEDGADLAALQAAVDFAVAHETRNPRDLVLNHYQTFGREPFGYAIGPIKERGDPTGLVIHHGAVIAEWGDPARVDMAHSITKSLLSSIVGVAFDRGMIRSLNDPVRDYVPPVLPYRLPGGDKADRLAAPELIQPFDTPHNRLVTWDHMLRQTSDWEGTLWGKPDWADRPGADPAAWTTRPRNPPGSAWKYNDVRVNALALAALQVWRRPLPQVLKETVMDPIGASGTWRWYGYENSWVVLDGMAVQSMTGGGHWGGGLFVNALDMARFGLLTLHRGKWNERQILSERWVAMALTPTPAEPTYGFMNWFLNTDRKLLPSAPASAFTHIGNGANEIYVDPEHDLVAVVRWIDAPAMDGFVQRLLAAIR